VPFGVGVVLVVALYAASWALTMLHEIRVARKRILRSPRLTVREVEELDQLPKWIALRAQTSSATAQAPLSGVDCAWFRLEAGNTEAWGPDLQGRRLNVHYTEDSSETRGIPLIDADDPENIIWLSEQLAGRSLGRGLPTPIATASETDNRDFPGLEVFERGVAPDTPVLVIGRPHRDGGFLSIEPAARGLTGTTTGPDSEIRRLFAVRARWWWRLLLASVLLPVVACGSLTFWD